MAPGVQQTDMTHVRHRFKPDDYVCRSTYMSILALGASFYMCCGVANTISNVELNGRRVSRHVACKGS